MYDMIACHTGDLVVKRTKGLHEHVQRVTRLREINSLFSSGAQLS
jgi:hypothetical protein